VRVGSEDGQLSDVQIGELVALADGSLPAGRRTSARQRVERSPELSAELEQQRRVVAAIRAWDAQAPAGLRARIEHDARSGAVACQSRTARS
jgi:hypothetical protein